MKPLSSITPLGCTIALGFTISTAPTHAQVLPSGTTATAVSAGASGRTNVSIAPANGSGISLNQYRTFSVPKTGVDLLNQGVNANTIINQVTSNNRSQLNGPLSVVGPTAHVIIANPSGITVDGGSFHNTGGVALTTGPIRFTNSATVAGLQNPVLETGAGDILVTGAGLSGSMSSLQLIAGRIKIDGPITNTLADPNADINVVAGNANVTLDASLMPGSTLKPWAQTAKTGGTSDDILVDVTPNGSITASRVSMVVSAQGAGVSFQGNGLASIGEFAIDADGQVSLSGARLQAEKDVKISNENLANVAAQDTRLAAAVKGSGTSNVNFSIGSGTAAEADSLGKIWVGDGARPMTGVPGGLVSADGTRVYRPAMAKPNTPAQFAPTGVQANFQQIRNGVVISNGHLDITQP